MVGAEDCAIISEKISSGTIHPWFMIEKSAVLPCISVIFEAFDATYEDRYEETSVGW